MTFGQQFNLQIFIKTILICFAFFCDLVSPRCLFIKHGTFEHYCRGYYPQEVSIKYRDKLITFGEPYAIYKEVNVSAEYLISLKLSELHSCPVIRSSGPQSYTCVPTATEIKFLRAMGLCHEYNLQIADELIRNCLKQNGRRHENFVSPQRQLLHYTLVTKLETSGAAVAALDNSQLSQMFYVMMVVAALCCCSYGLR
ncbi:uncharacterized protein LOC109611983 [Musca domestica]|uniref:Uncharacterized protein LOC109611983 n=1 Tax=Musca domestica TaxID=7370 RepID=A0A9J7DCT4_MUSDO|nr:uncharacterized protein LOC109611983 [Musca domestica]